MNIPAVPMVHEEKREGIMKYLNFNDLRAKLGGRGRSSIYRDVECGRLPPPIRIGGRLYWVEEDVDAWLHK